MSTLIGEVLAGDLDPKVCNAAVNAGGKMLKAVELQLRHGTPSDEGKTLHLVQPVRDETHTANARSLEDAETKRLRQRVARLELQLAQAKKKKS